MIDVNDEFNCMTNDGVSVVVMVPRCSLVAVMLPPYDRLYVSLHLILLKQYIYIQIVILEKIVYIYIYNR